LAIIFRKFMSFELNTFKFAWLRLRTPNGFPSMISGIERRLPIFIGLLGDAVYEDDFFVFWIRTGFF